MGIGGGDGGDDRVLIFGQRECGQIHAFAFPLIGKDDGYVGGLGGCCCCCWVVSGVVLDGGFGGARLNGLEGRGGEPDLFLPVSGALAWRGDGIPSRGVDLRGTAAGDHAHVRVRADDGDGADPGGHEREGGVLVLEQDDGAFFDMARDLEAHEGIDDHTLAGIVDDAGGEHGAQNAVDVLIKLGNGDGACVDGRFVFIAEEEAAGLLVIEAGG